jgi:CBS-domain-containing membrane protein
MANSFLIVGSLVSIAFFLVVAKFAAVTGARLLPFPELGALGFDIFTRPTGPWAQAPLLVVATPAAAAVVGTLVTTTLPYGIWSIALCIAGAMIIIRQLRSPVTPALSAALLPLSLGIASWWYPAAIVAATGCLALLSMIYNRLWASQIRSMKPSATDAQVDEMERPPRQYAWLPVFVSFLLLTYGISEITKLRLVLFPPLVAIAFEMFAHAEVCPWAKRPFALPLACTITAIAGVESVFIFGAGTVSIATAMLVGIATLRIFRVHLPPALAICLLPQMITEVDWRFVYSIAIGTVTLTGIFLLARSRLWIATPV